MEPVLNETWFTHVNCVLYERLLSLGAWLIVQEWMIPFEVMSGNLESRAWLQKVVYPLHALLRSTILITTRFF